MSAELLFASVLFLLSGVFSLVERQQNRKVLFVVAVFFVAIYAVSVRVAGPDSDIQVYYNWMEYGGSTAIYYLKEPVFWFGSYYTHQFLPEAVSDPAVVFLIFDALSIILAAYIWSRLGLPVYSFLCFFIFFPVFLGFQNVYRQYLCSIIFLTGMSYWTVGKSNKAGISLFFSFLTHQVSGLFLPMILMIKRRLTGKIAISSLSIIFLFFAIYYFRETKSDSYSGLNLSLLYISVQFLIFMLTIAVHALYRIERKMEDIFLVGYCFVLTILSYPLLGSAQVERVGMFGLIITIISIIQLVEKIGGGKRVVRLLLVISMSLPTFLFESTLGFMLPQ